MSRASAFAALALFLSGCGDGDESRIDDADELANAIENVSGAEPREKEKAPDPLPPQLDVLSPEDVARELAPGAGCDLSRDGGMLLAAVQGDAMVRANGRIVHLRLEGPVGQTGGFFEGPGVTVSIGRTSDDATLVDATSSWPATVAVANPLGGAPEAFDAVWRCRG